MQRATRAARQRVRPPVLRRSHFNFPFAPRAIVRGIARYRYCSPNPPFVLCDLFLSVAIHTKGTTMLARTQIPAIKRNKPVKGRRGERSDLSTAPSTTLALCASAVHYYTMIGEAWSSEYKLNIKDSPELSDCHHALFGLKSARRS